MFDPLTDALTNVTVLLREKYAQYFTCIYAIVTYGLSFNNIMLQNTSFSF